MNECRTRGLAIHTPLYVYTPVWTYTTVNLNRCPQGVDKGVYGGMRLGALPLQIFSQKLSSPRSNGHTMGPVLFLAYRRIFDARAA